MALADALVRRWEESGFEKTAMAIVDEALVLCERSTLCGERGVAGCGAQYIRSGVERVVS